MIKDAIRVSEKVLDHVINRINGPLNIVEQLLDNHDISEVKRYLDDEDRRHYQKNGEDVYSVTTVIDNLKEGENEGLKWWKRNNDGQGDNPDWEHLLEYKKNRGTLAHHAAMAPQYEELNGGEQLWSNDETESLYEVMDRAGDPSFLYSIVADKAWVNDQEGFRKLTAEEDIDIGDILIKDLEYFTQQYDEICQRRGINTDTLEAIEEMFVVPRNAEHDGYGGQVDLVYRDPLTGGAVVADLKTSSAVRDKHKHQVAAYAKAVEKTDNLPVESVERAEIIRIHPDSKESEVYAFSNFDKYWSEFAKATKEM